MNSQQVPRVFVLDGGFSSQLSCHVGDKVDGDPLWTARFLTTNPDDVVKTHLDFLRAGADAISTNTYQASVNGFVKYLNITPEDALKLISKAVDLAKEARDKYLLENNIKNSTPLIVGSVGPYGAHLNDGSEYSGAYAENTSKETMIEWHRPRFQELINAGVDLLALETIPCQKEAEALLELLGEFPKTKAWMSFSCKDDKHLAYGEEFQVVASDIWDSSKGQLIAVGVNCCSPDIVAPLFKGINMNRSNPIPLVVYPNSGEKYNPEIGWTDKDKSKTLNNYVECWLNMGVQYVGGCCRTYAEDVTKIRSEVNRWCKLYS